MSKEELINRIIEITRQFKSAKDWCKNKIMPDETLEDKNASNIALRFFKGLIKFAAAGALAFGAAMIFMATPLTITASTIIGIGISVVGAAFIVAGVISKNPILKVIGGDILNIGIATALMPLIIPINMLGVCGILAYAGGKDFYIGGKNTVKNIESTNVKKEDQLKAPEISLDQGLNNSIVQPSADLTTPLLPKIILPTAPPPQDPQPTFRDKEDVRRQSIVQDSATLSAELTTPPLPGNIISPASPPQDPQPTFTERLDARRESETSQQQGSNTPL